MVMFPNRMAEHVSAMVAHGEQQRRRYRPTAAIFQLTILTTAPLPAWTTWTASAGRRFAIPSSPAHIHEVHCFDVQSPAGRLGGGLRQSG
jgi:hypothetical protein